jgi:DNA-binding response OmpR family regulator
VAKKSVLVVDDDPDIRELITWKLGQAGYDTMVAADGEAGLAAVAGGGSEGRAPDLILVDWMMPKMSGIDVCRALRQNPLTSRIPVILLTANAQEADVELGFAAGVDDYIAKPFSPREMLSRIEAVLTRSEART